MTTAVELRSVVLDDQGRPIIAGTRFKVLSLAMEHVFWSLSAEELHASHPLLTLPQVYAALAYYYEHKDDLDREIAAEDEAFRQDWDDDQASPVREKLRRLGKLP